MKKLICLGVLLTTLVLGTGALAQNGGVALKNVRFVFSGQGDTIYAEVVNERPFRMENLEVRAFLEVPQGPAHQSGSQRFNLEPGEKLEVRLPLPNFPEATLLRLRVMQAMLTAPGMAGPLNKAIAALPAAERSKAEEAYRRLMAFDGRMAASSASAGTAWWMGVGTVKPRWAAVCTSAARRPNWSKAGVVIRLLLESGVVSMRFRSAGGGPAAGVLARSAGARSKISSHLSRPAPLASCLPTMARALSASAWASPDLAIATAKAPSKA